MPNIGNASWSTHVGCKGGKVGNELRSVKQACRNWRLATTREIQPGLSAMLQNSDRIKDIGVPSVLKRESRCLRKEMEYCSSDVGPPHPDDVVKHNPAAQP